MGRKKSLNKERYVAPQHADDVKNLLTVANIEKSILLFAKHIPSTARDWNRLSKMRTRIEGGDTLTDDDINVLIETETIIDLTPPVRKALTFLNKKSADTISRFLSNLACPVEALKPVIKTEITDDHDETAHHILEIAAKSPETAEYLLSGRLASARTAWLGRADHQNRDDKLFDEIIGTVRSYHLLDSLWLAGEDAARKQERPTGSIVIDGPGDGNTLKIRKIGAVLNDLEGARIVIGILDRVAKITSERKRIEALDRIFPGIMPLVRSLEADFRLTHGQNLEALLAHWDQVGRRLAEKALQSIETRIQNDHKGLSKGAYGNKSLAGYLQMPGEVLYLGFACGAWWRNMDDEDPTLLDADPFKPKPRPAPIDVHSFDPELKPAPIAFEKQPDWHAFYLIVKAYSMKNNGHALKGLVDRLGATDGGNSIGVIEETLIAAIDRIGLPGGGRTGTGPSSGLDARRTAVPLWNGLVGQKVKLTGKGRRLETECFGRFWLRMHL